MKLKQSPDDFVVEESTALVPAEQGPYAFYRLEKRGWTTPDALEAVRRRWNVVDGRRISYGGLKDRHAHTVQYLTIEHGPRRGLNQPGLTLRYLGQLPHPYGSEHIAANRFRVTLRDLAPGAVEVVVAALAEVERDGLPNYFDDQRFGSVAGPGRPFVAGEMVRGRYEGAVKLALAGEYEFDPAVVKREKESIRRHWGDWEACKAALPRGHARSIVDYLRMHPDDFRGALARLRPELSGLYLSAYQSDLWNRTLARWLAAYCPVGSLIALPLKMGEVPAPRGLPPDAAAALASLTVPLASPRLKWDDAAPWAGALRAVLAEEGVELSRMRLKGHRRPFFSKGERAALSRAAGLTHEIGDDDRHPGRRLVRLAFELPRGSYATLLVKRVTAARPLTPAG
jgi:tRNA pseudouridine13 synthase